METLEQNVDDNELKRIEMWKRLFLMVVYAVIESMVKMLIWLVVFLQVLSMLVTGVVNANILEFGRGLASYDYHILMFLTFNTGQLAFPFADWQKTLDLDFVEKK